MTSPMQGSHSRSPSPQTPESTDTLEPVSIHNDTGLDLSPWLQQAKALTMHPSWEMGQRTFIDPMKSEEGSMLRLDELLDQNAFDESSSSAYTQMAYSSSSPPGVSSTQLDIVPTIPVYPTTSPLGRGSLSLTKPVPPPASRPRNVDRSVTSQKVVYPPKESCFNLPIFIPSIPEGGTKSRVETQVRVTVELADSSSLTDSNTYNRVGSWKWLKLPPGTATKKRTRKQGKIDPDPEGTLHLTATVSCASPPHNRVLSCASCQTREAKRVAKKLAARVRPAHSDSDSIEDPSNPSVKKPKRHEDTTSIIQFNCAEVLDFSTGSIVLPLRITCYCRHHREKVGFNVHFTMIDSNGRIIGTGTSRSIMITDDHKTTSSARHINDVNGSGVIAMDLEWSRTATVKAELSYPETKAPSKRTKDMQSIALVKKRAKPYDGQTKRNKPVRETSVSSLPSPTTSFSTLPVTRSPTPPSSDAQFLSSLHTPGEPPLPPLSHESESSSETLATPEDPNGDVLMFTVTPKPDQQTTSSCPPPPFVPSPTTIHQTPANPPMVPFMFFDPSQVPTLPLPTIHRLIPNCGPTHGGIEVTVLGANFHASMQLNCVFGESVASSTHRWSDNTLVCVLPPRAMAGLVAVWFEGLPKPSAADNRSLSLFTYSDDSDRALMELALQVVGLKMTGKIEDAKNVAMRIVGGTGGNNGQSHNSQSSSMMQLSCSSRDVRPLLLARATEGQEFESLIIDFLSILDTPLEKSMAPCSLSTSAVISHQTCGGQTLLHFAAFLGFESLVKFLVCRGADLDARDHNGFTPLHFAALSSSKGCARALVVAGADVEIVDGLGKTAIETAESGFFEAIASVTEADSEHSYSEGEYKEIRQHDGGEDDEAEWGDIEEDTDDGKIPSVTRRAHRRKCHRQLYVSKSELRPSPEPHQTLDDKQEVDQSQKADEKQAASIMDMIQRTLSQLPAPQGMIPNMPQLPRPQFPQLPGLAMPNVPWNALPQIPMVFPVFVPMPAWPSFLSSLQGPAQKGSNPEMDKKETGAMLEWRAMWERWMTMRQAEEAPPQYTPRAENEEMTAGPSEQQANAYSIQEDIGQDDHAHPESSLKSISRNHSSAEIRAVSRRLDYSQVPVSDRDVNAYAYRPSAKQTQKIQKKHDRMLFSFWLPVLLFGLLYLLYVGIQFTFRVLKSALPLRSGSFIRL